MSDSFLDENYEMPVSGGGFTKLETGDNRLRILSSPLMMWQEWREDKIIRHPYDPNNKPPKGPGQKDSVKHSWGLIVWNYQTKEIEVLELDKQEVISSLVTHSRDADWGHPKFYDIVINKSGSGLDTTYKLIAKPKSEPSSEIVDAYTATPIDLGNLLKGASPFLSNNGDAASTTPAATGKVVTPENWVSGDPIPDGYEEDPDNAGKIRKKKLPF